VIRGEDVLREEVPFIMVVVVVMMTVVMFVVRVCLVDIDCAMLVHFHLICSFRF